MEGPAIVAIPDRKRRSAGSGETPATDPAPPEAPARPASRQSAIVTARKPGRRYPDLPEMTEQEHRAAGGRGRLSDVPLPLSRASRIGFTPLVSFNILRHDVQESACGTPRSAGYVADGGE